MAKKRKVVTPESLEKPGMVVPEYDSRLVNPQLNYVDVGGGVFETRTTTGGGIQSFDVFGATPTSPNIPKPGPTGPGATGPTGPGATGPTGPGATGPGATGPGATGPGATGPGATGPGATGPSSEEILAQFYEKIKADAAAQRRAAGESAYNLLFEEFSRYGLGSLVESLREFIEQGLSPAEFTIKLRGTKAYEQRFAANARRISKGLRALSEAEYIGLEDQYQNIMRQYGLPKSYYAESIDPLTGVKVQRGFEKFIEGDVSPVELEDRIQTAQSRVTNAPTQIKDALTQFYGAELGNGDVLAFVLDPERALPEIKRKITAAEIGGAATMAGLGTTRTRAEELGRFGITGEAARTGYGTIAGGLERGRQLSGIYQQPEYTQQIAETEVFQLPTAEEARRQRTRLGKLEEATFGGTTGMTGGALARDRAGAF